MDEFSDVCDLARKYGIKVVHCSGHNSKFVDVSVQGHLIGTFYFGSFKTWLAGYMFARDFCHMVHLIEEQ